MATAGCAFDVVTFSSRAQSWAQRVGDNTAQFATSIEGVNPSAHLVERTMSWGNRDDDPFSDERTERQVSGWGWGWGWGGLRVRLTPTRVTHHLRRVTSHIERTFASDGGALSDESHPSLSLVEDATCGLSSAGGRAHVQFVGVLKNSCVSPTAAPKPPL